MKQKLQQQPERGEKKTKNKHSQLQDSSF